ncbi:ABC transporter permease subunit [[Clostridium] symbiosum]|uniref:ABC transporter permease n=1 Tax=Clostridium symbiosum TaxID=1512 RepID=UPI001D06B769|nr:ABC transporter permease subunit [[Clostridium] symbiosum]MCB6609025.1 ABC transporter permease subunit [[Clostridium] symbiosum]MCB6930450.1 ABC transporter permease subunit [[Clostridium] symbiosum]
MQAKVEKKTGNKNKTLQRMWKDRVLYLMLAPTIIYFLIFRVWPIINMRLAFCNYKAKGPWEFAGLKYFNMIFKSSTFMEILRNTLIISFMKYILLFPFFVIFALLLNEIRCGKFRKYVQVVSYMPHFLSWVVIAGIWISMLSVSGGAVNQIMGWFGIDPVDFMTNKGAIRWVLFFSEGWRSLGWDSIVYFTAILAISPDLYEAATVDGAKRTDIIRYIILPALITPMTTMFILNLGFFMTAGFDQVFNFTNQSVNSVIDILDTYIYRIGLESGQYSLATAVALIKGVVGVFLVLVTHLVSKKMTGKGVW